MSTNWEQILKKSFIWSVVVLIAFTLRQFFLLIFLTFVFAYIQESFGRKISEYIPSRRLRTSLMGIATLIILTILLYLGAPRVKQESVEFIKSFPNHVTSANTAIATLPPFLYELLGFTEPPTVQSIWQMFNFGGGQIEIPHYISATLNSMVSIISSLFLAFLFSFLILFDLDALRIGIHKLSESRLSPIYKELVPRLANFGSVLGEALQAQLIIALLNTLLTALGVILLGIKGEMFLISTIVFLCSFIPIAGVFISSAPIIVISLQYGGISLAFLAAGYIILIHMVEAYILNPQIYGHQLKINPVFSLILLTLAGKLVGLWGLVLVLPITTYFIREVIFNNSSSPHH